uniref:Uncharacterized protein n=1 Tax=Parascaris equorum TaxID=6256 RepID=A0A914S1B0_PAREQ
MRCTYIQRKNNMITLITKKINSAAKQTESHHYSAYLFVSFHFSFPFLCSPLI